MLQAARAATPGMLLQCNVTEGLWREAVGHAKTKAVLVWPGRYRSRLRRDGETPRGVLGRLSQEGNTTGYCRERHTIFVVPANKAV